MRPIKHWSSVLCRKGIQDVFNLRTLSYLVGIVIFLACAAYLSLTIKHLIDTDVTFPVMDNWYHFSDLIRSSDTGDLLSYLFRQINEHRPVILKTAMWIDYVCSGFQLRFMAIFHLLSYGVFVASCIWLSIQIQTIQIQNEFDRSVKNAAKVLVAASGLFLLLNMRQWEVHFGYQNVGTIQGFLFFMISIYLYDKRLVWFASGNKVSHTIFAVVIFFALLSAASMAFGLLTILFLFMLSIFRSAPKKESWLLAILVGLFFFIYRIDMDLSQASKTEWHLNADEMLRVLYLASMMLGTLFTDNKLIALQIGTFGMVITAALSIQFVARKQVCRSAEVTMYGLLLLSLAYGFMVGIGRRHAGDEASMASRYMLSAAIYWQSLFAVSLYAGLQLFPRARLKTIALFLLILIAIIVNCTTHQMKIYKSNTHGAKANAVAVNALQYGVFDKDAEYPIIGIVDSLQYGVLDKDELGGINNDLFSRIKVFKDHQTAIYGAQIAKLYGHKIREKYVVDNNRCIGDISNMKNLPVLRQLVSDSSSMGLKVLGWAWRKQTEVKPSRILLVDQDEVIKGAGLFSVKRPDVAKLVGDPAAEDAGWLAFARLEQGATEINGYALYEKENVVCLFKKLKFPDELVVN